MNQSMDRLLPRTSGYPGPRIGVHFNMYGFTLIEAVIVLGVVGILLAISVPAVTDAVASTHAASVRTTLYESVVAAGNHATVTATEVVLCASADGRLCSGSQDWARGWIAFSDRDGDREHGSMEILVRRQEALRHGTRLYTTSGRTRLVFQSLGGAAGSNATFTLCDKRGPAKATAVVLANSGRIRTGKPTPAAANACVYSR